MLSVEEQIKIDEGFRGKPYLDSVGKNTIGFGRNLDDNPLTEEEAGVLLKNDLVNASKELSKFHFYAKLSPVRRGVLINMMFNMGLPTFLKFKKTIQAIKDGDFIKASEEMMDSKWAKQVHGRADRLALQMKTGKG